MGSNAPRVLKADMNNVKLVVFTDASLEEGDSLGRIGLVAYLVIGGEISSKFFFSDIVPRDIMRAWQTRTHKIISTLELWAAVAGGLFAWFTFSCFENICICRQ